MIYADVTGTAWCKEIAPGRIVHGVDWKWSGPLTAAGWVDKGVLRETESDPAPGKVVWGVFPWPIRLLELDPLSGIRWSYVRADLNPLLRFYAYSRWAVWRRTRLIVMRLRATAFIWGLRKDYM